MSCDGTTLPQADSNSAVKTFPVEAQVIGANGLMNLGYGLLVCHKLSGEKERECQPRVQPWIKKDRRN